VTNQLSFSGGGAFGAVEIGIIKKIRESYAVPYERYTGISAGGLNAGFLSHYADLDEVLNPPKSCIRRCATGTFSNCYRKLVIRY